MANLEDYDRLVNSTLKSSTREQETLKKRHHGIETQIDRLQHVIDDIASREAVSEEKAPSLFVPDPKPKPELVNLPNNVNQTNPYPNRSWSS